MFYNDEKSWWKLHEDFITIENIPLKLSIILQTFEIDLRSVFQETVA